jgi:ribosomal protein S18 acetylase RimI-like enzyme
MQVRVDRIDTLEPGLLEGITVLLRQLSTSNRNVSATDLDEIIKSSVTELLVARTDAKIVGMLTLVLVRIPTKLRAQIEDVVVLDSFRGKGIGEALIRAALRSAELAGAAAVDLTSRPSRASAGRLYERVGFIRRETDVYRISLRG